MIPRRLFERWRAEIAARYRAALQAADARAGIDTADDARRPV